MSSDLAISSPTATTQAAALSARPGGETATTGSTSSGAQAAPPVYPNPSMHIDPALNLLVIEFHNAEGRLTDSTPTQRQLDAYRQAMPPKPA